MFEKNFLALIKEDEKYFFFFDDSSFYRALIVLDSFASNQDLGFTKKDAEVVSKEIRALWKTHKGGEESKGNLEFDLKNLPNLDSLEDNSMEE